MLPEGNLGTDPALKFCGVASGGEVDENEQLTSTICAVKETEFDRRGTSDCVANGTWRSRSVGW